MKILVVDDEEAIRDSLDLVLRFEHHEVSLAKDGQEGLKALKDDPDIELVFLDIKMPGRDGMEVLAEVVERSPDLPVVMISGHGTIETAMEATRRGAFHFLEKPVDPGTLAHTIRQILDG